MRVTGQHYLGAELVPPPPATAAQFTVLDTLRAVGALLVLTTHTSFQAGAYVRHGTWGTMLARMDVGVAIFFVLSGFLLARPFLARSFAGAERPATGHYLWKRFLRIAPVYWLTVVFALVLLKDNDGVGVTEWVTTLLMLNTFVDPTLPYGLTHMWSLAVEVTFYLVLPLLMIATVGRRPLRPYRVVVLIVAMCATCVWWLLDGAERVAVHVDGSPREWLPSYLTWFAVGLGLALVSLLHQHAADTGREPGRLVSIVAAVGRQPGVCWAIAGGLFLVASTPLTGPIILAPLSPAEALTKNLLYAGIGGMLVLSGAFAVKGEAYESVFGHVSLRRLGWISYSIFCLHMTVLQLVMQATGWPLFGGHGLELWTLTLLVTVVLAELTYRIVERPALRLKDMRPGSWSRQEVKRRKDGRRGRRHDTETNTETSGNSIT